MSNFVSQECLLLNAEHFAEALYVAALVYCVVWHSIKSCYITKVNYSRDITMA